MQWNLHAKWVLLTCEDSKDSLDLPCANDLRFISRVDDVAKIMCNKSRYTKDPWKGRSPIDQEHLLDDIHICI